MANISDQPRASNKFGITLIVVATILWSTSGVLTQFPSLRVWSDEKRGLNIAFWRALFALLILVPLVRRISWKPAMVPMIMCFIIMTLSFLTAIIVGSPANTIWLQYLAPTWVMLGAICFYGDRPIPRDWCMLGFCLSGVLFILVMEGWNDRSQVNSKWWAPLLAVLSGVSYAGVILSMRGLTNEDPAWLIALNHFATAVVVAPIIWFWGVTLPLGNAWFVLIVLGVFQMGLPYYLFAKGLKSTPTHIASLISLMEPVLLPLWVHLARMNEPDYVPPGWWTWVGASMILSGLIGRYAFLSRPIGEASR